MEFKTADQALRWSYRTSSRPVLKLSGIYSMRGAAATNPDLSPFEIRAQAAQICRWVDALPLLDRAYVHANYARAVDEIEHRCLVSFCRKALQPGVHADRGIVLLCSVYMGQHVGWRALRAELHCKNEAVPVLRDQLFTALEAMHERVIGYLDRQFRSAGLILEEA